MGWRDLFSQWNTKTLGGSSKLGVSDYELITDGVHVEVDNLEALEAKNTVGQATNLQSQSGPIVGTQQIIQTTYTSTGDEADFFKPTEGIWQIVGGDTVTAGGTGAINWALKDSDGTLAMVFQTTVNGQEPITEPSVGMKTPVYVSPENWLYANIVTVATSVRASISFIRVR